MWLEEGKYYFDTNCLTWRSFWSSRETKFTDAGLILSFLFQVSLALHHPYPGIVAPRPGCYQLVQSRFCRLCSNINHQRHGLSEHLRHGIRSDTEYHVLGNLPYQGPWAVHYDLRSHVLGRKHHRHLHASSVAQLDRPCRPFLNLCSRMHCVLDICVFEGSRDQGHASGGHLRVICRGCESGFR